MSRLGFVTRSSITSTIVEIVPDVIAGPPLSTWHINTAVSTAVKEIRGSITKKKIKVVGDRGRGTRCDRILQGLGPEQANDMSKGSNLYVVPDWGRANGIVREKRPGAKAQVLWEVFDTSTVQVTGTDIKVSWAVNRKR